MTIYIIKKYVYFDIFNYKNKNATFLIFLKLEEYKIGQFQIWCQHLMNLFYIGGIFSNFIYDQFLQEKVFNGHKKPWSAKYWLLMLGKTSAFWNGLWLVKHQRRCSDKKDRQPVFSQASLFCNVH